MFPEPKIYRGTKNEDTLPELLISLISRYFGANYFLVDDDPKILEKELNYPSSSRRGEEFKRQLADAICHQSINPKVLYHSTKIDYEIQEQVDQLLKTQIWQLIYGDKPITLSFIP